MRLARNDAVKFRLSEFERQLLQAIADGDAQNVSETVRWLIREEARRRGLLVLVSEAHANGGVAGR